MRVNEAQAIGRALADLRSDELDPILNLGSSTRAFREVEQPQIDRFVFAPLRKRGITIHHADMKAADGVDLVGNVYDPAFQARIREVGPATIICSNMLEHLEDRARFLSMCDAMLPVGGLMLITVPYDYPYHQDPIDTYFRPTPDDLASMLPNYTCIWSDIVRDARFKDDFAKLPTREKMRRIASLWKAPVLYVKDRARFLGRYHRWLWWNRPYKVSCILLRKTA